MKASTNKTTTQFFILILTLIAIIGIASCTSKDSAAAANQNSSTVAASSQVNSNQSVIDSEKEKLEKERAKLEKEKQDLKDEKAKTEKLKNASPPSQEVSTIVSTVNPPSNIRDSPNGKILCTVKEQGTMIKLYGSTDITDNNGEWFYTKHCGGKMGVIHSTQFVMPG